MLFMQSNYLKIIYLFLLILGACAKIPDSDLAKMSQPVALDSSTESALAREFFTEGGWPTERWWYKSLNSLIDYQ